MSKPIDHKKTLQWRARHEPGFWLQYEACSTCGAGAGTACANLSNRSWQTWTPAPHRGRKKKTL